MSCYTKTELENMLEDVINKLHLSDAIILEHFPIGTPPAVLVHMVLAQKDKTIQMLKSRMIEIEGGK